MKAEELRKSILQLAIQGKLVPQDPNDEPASVLLERIRAEKQRLIKEGKIKKDKGDSIIFKGDDNCYYEQIGKNEPILIEDLPFDIPNSWAWERINNVVMVNPRNSLNDELEVSFIEMKSLREGFNNDFVFENKKWKTVKKGFTHFQNNDVCFAKITPCFQNRKSAVLTNLTNGYGAGTTELHILRTFSNTILPEYLLWFVKSPYFIETGKLNFSGTAGQQRFGTDAVKNVFIPIPSLSEQLRIVAELGKYEPLLLEYNKLEREKSKLDSEIYDKLKKSILQYAIQGKLVPQDPNDEPASVLLERIRAEKKAQLGKKYVESYIYKGDDNCYYEKIGKSLPVLLDNLPLEIPANWCWVKLGDIAFITKLAGFEYTKFIAPNLQAEGVPLFKGKNIQDSKIVYEFEGYISEKLSNELPRSQITKKCILTPYVGTIGNIGIHDKSGLYHLGSNVGKIELLSYNLTTEEFVVCYLKSIYGYKELTKYKKATAQESISIEAIREVYIPLPPLEEQKRILRKIEEIFRQL